MTLPTPTPTPTRSKRIYEQLASDLRPLGLMIYGGVHPHRVPVPQLGTGTLILIGTAQDFWTCLTAAPEGQDGTPDPVDSYSRRTIGALADRYRAVAYYPFGGPPYTPFVAWALASGRAFTSPSQMLVHDEVGMLISYRGALHFDKILDIPAPARTTSPCVDCADRPCLSACPVHALVDGGPYKLAACHDHLDTPQGTECMASGCIARRACPLSDGAGRPPAQTAHHMRYFHHP
ncbi:ferredoxin [Epibacterium sp. MM17-32]|uniref:ferredoxin n=1 Tax=Epibacterium sp. MM17-32 TaxID=2917734 RepID=UPI001EF424A2|nr:ferredoxin [Epibacterium sp. MM17-32]MCG7628879.1 ferredoxin [Epibacterium sp. MM17-32]